MNTAIKSLLLFLSLSLAMPSIASATVTEFTNSPSSNSTDWATYITSNGGKIDEINFDDHPTGPLQNDFYSASKGVTFSTTGQINTVTFGTGPGQAGGSSPTSIGEGIHPRSNYLLANDVASSLTVTFERPALGAGLFVIDLFNPGSQPSFRNSVTLSAFTGPNGSGTLLATLDSSQFNFQPNGLYFFGLTSTGAPIRSVRFDHPSEAVDQIGVDNIRFAIIPEPSTVLLLSLGVLGWIGRRHSS